MMYKSLCRPQRGYVGYEWLLNLPVESVLEQNPTDKIRMLVDFDKMIFCEV